MLILTRKPGESLYIGDNIKITIVELKGHQIRVGIDAPAELRIYREEIYLQILEENQKAAEAAMSPDIGVEGVKVSFPGVTGKRVAGAGGGSGSASDDDEDDEKKNEGTTTPKVGGFSNFFTSKIGEKGPHVVVKRKKPRRPDE